MTKASTLIDAVNAQPPAVRAAIRAELEVFRLYHKTCEDSWYSCPLSAEGCADDRETTCNCGADDRNKTLDAIIGAIQ